ncbi:MAG TPA: hypothetical protein VMG12_18240 [Polyangiaceae bacterium]|nr:hypothetical protein [Polyangiaceae bacterium]
MAALFVALRALSVSLAAAAPAGSASAPMTAVSPVVAASVTPAAGNESEPKTGALPRQFSVEVGPGGVLVADGTRLGAATELERWAQRASTAARFNGAVVFGDEARDGAVISEVVERLHRAGFAEVRRVGRAAPVEWSALAKAAPPVIAGRPAPAASAPRASAASAAAVPRAPTVTLASVGLHVDGVLNREPHRTRLVRVFEREFNAFRRCHERAERHAEGASFGVDLLIPKDGGRGKVRQTRTRLGSKDFRSCMLGVFEAIRFAPPPSERPEIVSYSVLFKPNAR